MDVFVFLAAFALIALASKQMGHSLMKTGLPLISGFLFVATNPTIPSDMFNARSFMYSGLMACDAFNRIFGGRTLLSINHNEQISTPVTLAVTITMSFKRSSRYRSDVMAPLISIRALMYGSGTWAVVFTMK